MSECTPTPKKPKGWGVLVEEGAKAHTL